MASTSTGRLANWWATTRCASLATPSRVRKGARIVDDAQLAHRGATSLIAVAYQPPVTLMIVFPDTRECRSQTRRPVRQAAARPPNSNSVGRRAAAGRARRAGSGRLQRRRGPPARSQAASWAVWQWYERASVAYERGRTPPDVAPDHVEHHVGLARRLERVGLPNRRTHRRQDRAHGVCRRPGRFRSPGSGLVHLRTAGWLLSLMLGGAAQHRSGVPPHGFAAPTLGAGREMLGARRLGYESLIGSSPSVVAEAHFGGLLAGL